MKPPRLNPVNLIRSLAGVYLLWSLYEWCVWFTEIQDRVDGDSLRWGFNHSPWMQIPPFDEPFLDLSLLALWWSANLSILGATCLLMPTRWAVPLVKLGAYSTVIFHAVIVFFTIEVIRTVLPIHRWEEWYVGNAPLAIALRLTSITLHLGLCIFLNTPYARRAFAAPA